ncbi:MAG: xylulokinase [Chthoniobacterales bacterium]
MISLGVDCGTQSLKTVALDVETGKVLRSAQQKYDLIGGLPPGAAEQHPQDWVDAMESTIRQVTAGLGDRASEIAAIGVSGQQHGLVALDEHGEVVRPAKLWCDTSTAAECEKIEEAVGGGERALALGGNRIVPGYTAPKIRWLQDHEPENWRATRAVMLPHDYLNFWLTGEAKMEFGDASGTGFLDVRTREWCAALVEATADGLREKLPPLGSSLRPVGRVKESLAATLGLPDGVLVSAGGGDNMMGAIGTGNVGGGVVTASLGTSGTLYASTAEPVIDTKGEIAAFCDSTDRWLPLLCTMNVTLVTELARELWGWDHGQFDAEVAATSPGADGLLLLPYLTGERTPSLPNATGTLHGLTSRNFTPGHLARAAMEGVTLGLGYGLQRLTELGLAPKEIRLTGGGTNSAAWRRICADIFGVPVVCLETGEGAGLGAAVQAAWQVAAEAASDASMRDLAVHCVATDESTRVEPKADASAMYAESIDRMNRLRTALVGAGMLG